MASELPFDAISIGTGEQIRRLAVSEFLALPFDHRVRAILQGSIAFWAGELSVDTQRALRALRDRDAAPGTDSPLRSGPTGGTGSGIRLHWRSAALLVADFDHAVDDEAFHAYLAELEAVLARGRPYATLCFHHGDWPTPPGQRELQAAFLYDHRAELAALCRGVAFVIPHAVPRLVLAGIFLVQHLPTVHAVFETEAAAVAWLSERIPAIGG